MKSQIAWDASNKYALDLMVWVAVIITSIQLLLIITFDPTVSIIAASALVCAMLVALMIQVENFLKKNFDSDGRPIN